VSFQVSNLDFPEFRVSDLDVVTTQRSPNARKSGLNEMVLLAREPSLFIQSLLSVCILAFADIPNPKRESQKSKFET